MTTYDENGGYPHPDHIMCHRVSMEAFEAAGDPDRYPGTGDPWQPLKLYYHQTFTRARVQAFHDALVVAGRESPYEEWMKRFDEWPQRQVTTQVACSDYFDVRDRALLSHATQVDPDGAWFAVPLEMQVSVWPTEDYELARSLVDTDLPETDLFAGIRPRAEATAAPAPAPTPADPKGPQ